MPFSSPSTANPWFCVVISTCPVSEILHRVIAAPVAIGELHRLARRRRARRSWWPRQIPKIGIPCLRQGRGWSRTRKSPRPDRPGRWRGRRPSGCIARTCVGRRVGRHHRHLAALARPASGRCCASSRSRRPPRAGPRPRRATPRHGRPGGEVEPFHRRRGQQLARRAPPSARRPRRSRRASPRAPGCAA